MLKDVCAINMGQSPDSNSYNDNGEGVPFFQGNADFGERYPITRKWCTAPTKMASPKDILISVRAPIGAMNYAKEACCIGRGLAAITPDKKKVSLEFIFWLLKGKKSEMDSKGTGSTFKAIGRKILEEILVPDISLEKQIEYSAALEKVYGIIQARKLELKKLDDLIKARFVEMFGDPVNNEKGFVQAPMGDYMTLLTDFSSNGSYKTLDSGVTMYDEPNYAWMVRTTDLESGDMDSIKYIDKHAYELLAKSKIFGGEIIMNKIGSAGKIYFMPKVDMPASLGRNAFMFRYDDRINVKFLYYLLTSDYGQREIQQYVKGAVTKTITKNDARAILIIVPPIELQNEFEQFVEQVDKSKAVVQKALDQTQLLFDSLMQEYFG